MELLFCILCFSNLVNLLTAGSPCPPNWMQFQEEKCVLHTMLQESFNDAVSHCERHWNAKLLTINSKAEEDFLVVENSYFFFWIAVKTTFIDVNGSLILAETDWIYHESNYTNWDTLVLESEDVHGKELCTEMQVGSNVPIWMPQDCEGAAFTICEKPIRKENSKIKASHEEFLQLLQVHLSYHERNQEVMDSSTGLTTGDTTISVPVTQNNNRTDFKIQPNTSVVETTNEFWVTSLSELANSRFAVFIISLGLLIIVLQLALLYYCKAFFGTEEPQLTVVKAKSNEYMTLVKMESVGQAPRAREVYVKRI